MIISMSLLEMSVTGGIMALAVTVLRAVLLNRLPKKTFVLLWETAMLRLLLPISVPSVLSVYTFFNWAETLAQGASPQMTESNAPVIANALTEGNNYQAALIPIQENGASVASLSVWTVVWLAGAAVSLAVFIIGYIRVFRKYRCGESVKSGYPIKWLSEQKIKRSVKIRFSKETLTPLTYGIFRPVILLPEGTDTEKSERLVYILAHEMTHIKRFDMVRKTAAALVLSIHWFNPLVWVAFALYNRDIELACDEAVVRETGLGCRSAYAMALIGMEEERRKISLFSHFSRNAAEERIVAIMKVKKITAAAAAAACAAVLGVTGVFATSAVPKDGKADNKASDENKSIYSEGETTLYQWKEENIDLPAVEWWTYEDFKAWLEEEKAALQDMLGEKGRTGGRGDFVWTQEIINETVAMYEDLLEQIKNGAKVSKSVDGNTDTMLIQGTSVTSISENQSGALGGWADISQEDLLEKFGAFGISFDKDDKMLYNGETVRFFCDGCQVSEGGWATRYAAYNEKGTIDVYTVYEPVPNGDGSTDPFGKLMGLRKASKEEFDLLNFGFTVSSDIISKDVFITSCEFEKTYSEAFSEGSAAAAGTSFENIFAKYKKYGIEYKAVPNGLGNVYYNGEPVKHFSDLSPDGSAFSFESTEGGKITVTAIYDENGNLKGVEKVS